MNDLIGKAFLLKKVLAQGIWNANITILMYHRVEDIARDPWLLGVSTGHFRQQIQVLKQYNVISMQRFIENMRIGKLTRSLVITFDDGYKDNFYHAAPVLQSANLPATFFISSGYTGTQNQFWSNDLDSLFLSPGELPKKLDIKIKNISFSYDLMEDRSMTAGQLAPYRNWIAWEAPPTRRHALYVEMAKLIKSLTPDNENTLLEMLYEWSGMERKVHPGNLMMDKKEIKELSMNPLFEIGGHTVSHPELSALSPENQRKEIINNKTSLENIIGRPVYGMAYPYGAYNAVSVREVEKAGLLYACTTKQQPVTKNSSLFELPRFRVRSWNGIEFKKRLDRWLKLGI